MIDLEFRQAVSGWHHDTWALRPLFTTDELQRLEDARRRFRPDRRTIAYCVYENPFAKSGGLFAVAKNLPPALRDRNHAVVILSPLHTRLKQAPIRPEDSAQSPLVEGPHVQVTFGDREHAVRLWECRSDEGFAGSCSNAPVSLKLPAGHRASIRTITPAPACPTPPRI